MSKKHKHEEHVNHERWLVSYADFITLLFAFFTVLYATNQGGAGANAKTQEVIKAIERAFAQGLFSGGPSLLGEGGFGLSLIDLGLSMADLKKDLEKMEDAAGESHGFSVTSTSEGVVITLKSMNFFRPGSDEIVPEAMATIRHIADELKKSRHGIRIEGHTDSLAIQNDRFESNWDLSAARSLRVLNQFLSLGISSARLSLSAYADNKPADTNDTEEGRSRNRRVVITILNDVVIMDGQPDASVPVLKSDEPLLTRPPVPIKSLHEEIDTLFKRTGGLEPIAPEPSLSSPLGSPGAPGTSAPPAPSLSYGSDSLPSSSQQGGGAS